MSELIEKLEPGERLTFVGVEYPGGLCISFRKGKNQSSVFVSYREIQQHSAIDLIAYETSKQITIVREME